MRNKRQKYIGYDYDRLHTRLMDETKESELDQVIDVRTGCIYETKTITSGIVREVEIYPTFLKRDVPEEWKIQKCKKAQQNLNDKNARKYFVRKLNTNFGAKDYYITLTYTNENLPMDHMQAKKNLQNYFRRLNWLYVKKQIAAGITKSKIKKIKYMAVTEHGEGPKGIRCHHHLVMNSVLDMKEVEEAWKLGRRNNIRLLDPDELWLTGLATYLTKDPKGKKRWTCSKNLKEPKITKNGSKFTKKKINKMVNNHNLIKDEIERNNQGYIFVDSQVFINDYNGKSYIYARLRKIDKRE